MSKRALDKRGFDSHQPPHLFVNGVEKDSNFPEGTVYIFKKQLCVEDEVYQIYIKIKYVEKKDYMVLLSFHESEEGEGNV
ncbi:MAG: hypothetical protein WBI86_01260 [Defluviitoga tunisiensis]